MKCRLLPQPVSVLLFLVLTRLCRTRPPPHPTQSSLVPCNITSPATYPKVDMSPTSREFAPSDNVPPGASKSSLFGDSSSLQFNHIPATGFASRRAVSHQFLPPVPPLSNNFESNSESSSEEDYMDYYYYDDADYAPGGQRSPLDNITAANQPPPGLNRVAKLKLIRTPRRQPPEYMLDLYDRFSKAASPVTVGTTASPSDDDPDLGADIVRSFPNINKEVEEIEEEETNSIDISQDADETQQQQLPGRETRHHTLVFNLTSVLTGEKVSRAELRLYTLVARDRSTYVGEDRLVTVHEGLRPRHQPPIAERHVYGRSSGWEAFDVTDVVQKWVRGGVTSSDDGVRVLEVAITSVFNSSSSAALDVDIDVDPEHNEGPLLVVFSRDIRYHNRKDLQNMIDHESDVRGSDTATGDNGEISKQFGGVSHGRTRRAARMLQREDELPVVVTNRTEASPVRVRRDNGNTKRKRNSCRRQPMYVDFQEINWHQWIIAPPGYQAFECVGKCYVPIGAHLSPTKHAIIQTLVHAAHPKQAARACCVPTKLEPISILYLDANNIITYKYHYDGMVVAECGCR